MSRPPEDDYNAGIILAAEQAEDAIAAALGNYLLPPADLDALNRLLIRVRARKAAKENQ